MRNKKRTVLTELLRTYNRLANNLNSAKERWEKDKSNMRSLLNKENQLKGKQDKWKGISPRIMSAKILRNRMAEWCLFDKKRVKALDKELSNAYMDIVKFIEVENTMNFVLKK